MLVSMNVPDRKAQLTQVHSPVGLREYQGESAVRRGTGELTFHV